MIDPNDAPEGYEAKAPLAGKPACTGCAFNSADTCTIPDDAPYCDGIRRKDRSNVNFVKKEQKQ